VTSSPVSGVQTTKIVINESRSSIHDTRVSPVQRNVAAELAQSVALN
jgi:hypothetical protein